MSHSSVTRVENVQEYLREILFTLSFAPQVGRSGRKRGTKLERTKTGKNGEQRWEELEVEP